jgi:putative transferase (TIGR04331 family)
LAGLKRRVKYNPKGEILWVSMSLPRYFYFFYSVPIGSQVINYIQEQERFAKAVSQDVRDLLLLRLYHNDYGWDQEKRWLEIDSNLKIYHGTKSMTQQLQHSRMLISTYNSTTYLESFAANFPTIIFWNPKHWELRDAAKPFFNELHQAGILHYTPESAAAKVNEIYQDPKAWWQQPEIQNTKNNFCDQFAKTSDDWMKEWKKALKSISSK